MVFDEPVGADAGDFPVLEDRLSLNCSDHCPNSSSMPRTLRAARLDPHSGHVRRLGIHCNDIFFAIIADETLYLKADAESAVRFQETGEEPFQFPYKDGRTETMNYWTVPEEAMESTGEMIERGRLALAAVIRCSRRVTKALQVMV